MAPPHSKPPWQLSDCYVRSLELFLTERGLKEASSCDLVYLAPSSVLFVGVDRGATFRRRSPSAVSYPLDSVKTPLWTRLDRSERGKRRARRPTGTICCSQFLFVVFQGRFHSSLTSPTSPCFLLGLSLFSTGFEL
jgi:hypothetical protein